LEEWFKMKMKQPEDINIKMPQVYTKYYSCFNCKHIIPCIPNNYKNSVELKEFLKEHGNHTIALLNKNQIKNYSDKRFREFNYKLKNVELNF